MLGSHCRVLEGFVQLFLHALVLNHLVQLCLTMIFNVAIGCLNGLACHQRHGQECAPVAPLDAVDQDVVAVPHGVLHCWPDVCPLLRSLLAVSRCKSHELSAWQGHPPPALRTIGKAADLLRGAWAVPEPTPKRSKWRSSCSPALLHPPPFLGMAANLLCGLPAGADFGAALGGVLGIAFGGVLGAAAPRAFFTAAHIAVAMSSAVGSAAALFLVNAGSN